MIVPKHYENIHVLHENTMPNRSYYIPASVRRDDLVESRENSDRFQLLSGEWKFNYFSSIYEMEEHFFAADHDPSGYDTVRVPGVWQNYGYDSHQYTNYRYPIPFDPPYAPQENPCGAYVREFVYEPDADARRAYLNFEGVDSCFYVWMNGSYVGYSQVSHSTSEFDVTDFLQRGTNKLAVLVMKWCDGTYFEDQDKFRMSGIFRDVYLLKRPEQCVFDYFVTTKLGENGAEVNIQIKPLNAELPVQIAIYDREDRLVGTADAAMSDPVAEYPMTAEINVGQPHLWNAEQPYLYTLVLKTDREMITDRVGIRQVEIRDNVVLMNGTPVKFRGVNRHDSDPVNGYAVTFEQMKKDLVMMKEYNFNAVRTSHYPNSPVFYQLCDQYGFYLIDEADHESHGSIEIYYRDDNWEKKKDACPASLVDNPDYNETVLDRTKRCVYRDKNRPSVVIWSMGNESFYGCTIEHALAWTKAFDPSRLTHYEGTFQAGKYREFDYSNLELWSRMYPTLAEIREYLDNEPERPFILCEYCHAMGNGPGDLEDYFELIYGYEEFCGGFVWEWCDHAIDKGQAENGKTIYYYGGDHGETRHDGNFCMDGLVYPDRRPHTGVMEYKNVHRPARVTAFDQGTGTVILHNYMDFVDLKDYVDLVWEVDCDGEIVASGLVSEAEMVSIPPHTSGEITLNIPVPERGKCYLKLAYLRKTASEILKKGHFLGFDEILLQNEDGRNQVKLGLLSEGALDRTVTSEVPGGTVPPEQLNGVGGIGSDSKLCVAEDDRSLTVSGEGFSYRYSKLTGMFEQLVNGEKHLLDRPMELNIWRAPTDNDRYIRWEWDRAQYHRALIRSYETEWKAIEEGIQIRADIALSAVYIQRMLEIKVVWTVTKTGRIGVEMQVRKNPEFPSLPRFGIRLFLPKEMDRVTYYGMGPQESYVDKHRASSHSRYSAAVSAMHEDYLRPQENGSHFDCDYVILQGEGKGLTVVGEQTFSFNVSVYTQEELEQKAHNFELEESGSTVLCLDYAHNGIGSNSCGPELLKRYRFDEEAFRFALELIPGKL